MKKKLGWFISFFSILYLLGCVYGIFRYVSGEILFDPAETIWIEGRIFDVRVDSVNFGKNDSKSVTIRIQNPNVCLTANDNFWNSWDLCYETKIWEYLHKGSRAEFQIDKSESLTSSQCIPLLGCRQDGNTFYDVTSINSQIQSDRGWSIFGLVVCFLPMGIVFLLIGLFTTGNERFINFMIAIVEKIRRPSARS